MCRADGRSHFLRGVPRLGIQYFRRFPTHAGTWVSSSPPLPGFASLSRQPAPRGRFGRRIRGVASAMTNARELAHPLRGRGVPIAIGSPAFTCPEFWCCSAIDVPSFGFAANSQTAHPPCQTFDTTCHKDTTICDNSHCLLFGYPSILPCRSVGKGA